MTPNSIRIGLAIRTTLLNATLCALTACSGGSSGGPPTAPPGNPGPGDLDLTLRRAPGAPLRLFSGRIALTGPEERAFDLVDDESRNLSDLPSGDYRVEVSDLTVDCATTGPASRSVTIRAGETVVLVLEVTCAFVPEERFVYNSFRANEVTSEILSARLDGSDVRHLTGLGNNQTYADWSPDGTRILYQGDFSGAPSLWVMNHDGTERTTLRQGRRPSWSPNGRRIAYELDSDIFVADIGPRKTTNAVNLTGDGGATNDGAPTWSPDGTRIAFSRDGEVHVMNADGSGVTPLGSGTFPVWSPDGRSIYFVDPAVRQIGSMRTDGTDRRILTAREGGAGHPDPSPDGSEVVFHSPSFSLDSRIWVMKADGSDVRRIEAIPAHAEHPDWSP